MRTVTEYEYDEDGRVVRKTTTVVQDDDQDAGKAVQGAPFPIEHKSLQPDGITGGELR